jgi:hypothetical protein
MFLYSVHFNEGSSCSQTGKVKKNELREGKNPKAKLIPSQTINQWATSKKDSLVNQKWEKLRKSL